MLADRVGIIDRGRIVAEGTPEALKAEIGRPSVEAIPQDPAELDAHEGGARRASASPWPARPRAPRCGSPAATPSSPRWCARSTAENIEIQELQLHAPTLDDVFLAKTGRSLEGEADAEPEREPEPRRREPGPAARAALGGAHAAPAGDGRARRSSSRCCCSRSTAAASTAPRACPASRPTRYFQFALAIPFIQGALFSANSAGTNVANDIETGFLNRLVAHAAAAGGADDGPARRDPRARPDPGAHVPARRASCSATASRPGLLGRVVLVAAVADDLARASAASARSWRCGPATARPCRACSRSSSPRCSCPRCRCRAT